LGTASDIDDSPIKFDLSRHIDELVEVHRLHDIGIRPEGISFEDVLILGRGS
jgi:hypothetical protein